MRRLLDEFSLLPGPAKFMAVLCVILLVVGTGGLVVMLRGEIGGRQPVASAARAASTPRAIATAAPTPAANPVASLACKLPISNGGPGSGGFLQFPSGDFTPDPASNVSIPALGGSAGLSYSRSAARWLPVPRDWVRPDGRAYVFFSYQSQSLMLADLNGSATVLGGPAATSGRQNNNWQILSAEAAGVYVLPPSDGGPPAGLWLFPYSGTARQVTGTGYWQAVGGGAAWGTTSASVPQGAATAILRYDLASGATSQWFSQPQLNARVLGFDAAGVPVVIGNTPDEVQVWLAQGGGPVKLLSVASTTPQGEYGYGPGPGGPGGQNQFYVMSVVGDGHGVWVGTSQGLYFSAGGTAPLVKVSPVTGVVGSGCF